MKRSPIKQLEDFKQISWLAGLFEGEGSFVYLTKSNQVRLALEMCDEDVVARAAEMMGLPYFRITPKNSRHKASYKFNVSGRRAAYYRELILPHMGHRRSEAIRVCLHKVAKSAELRRLQVKKLSERVSDTELLWRWENRDPAMSFRAFARSLGISSRTSLASRVDALIAAKSRVDIAATAFAPVPLDYVAWLAGLFEGEAHFRVAVPAVQMVLKMTDEDIVSRVAKLLGRPYFIEKARNPKHKDCFCLTVNGLQCVEVARAIKPFMGQRRLAKIIEIVCAYEAKVLPCDEVKNLGFERWINRAPGESVLGVARSLGIKGSTFRARLVRAGLYKTSNARQKQPS